MKDFPIINTMDDVLPAIEGRDEFLVKDKGEFIIIDYCVQKDDTFIDKGVDETILALRRECRGITFDSKTKKIVARKYHKFHNINENDECQFHNIDITKPHIILDKLDGSLINIIKTVNGYQFHTKNGHTDVAIDAENQISNKEPYFKLQSDLDEAGATALFEYVSPTNRIVVKYDEPKLILTAIRENKSGRYWFYDTLCSLGKRYNIDVVQCKSFDSTNLKEIIDEISNIEDDIEGFVLRFKYGQMYKIKTSLYVQLHKSKEASSNEKIIWQLILDGKIDDLKCYLTEEDLSRVNKFEQQFTTELLKLTKSLNEFIKLAKSEINANDDKEFKKILATEYVLKYPIEQLRPFILNNIYEDDCLKRLLLFFRKNCYRQVQIDNIRYLLNDLKYNLTCELKNE